MSLVNEFGSLIDPYKNFIAISRYARWDEKLGRRETWVETVKRYVNYMRSHVEKNYPGAIPDDFWAEAEEAIVNHKVMPSMRALMTAGPALDRSHVAGYNPVAGDTKVLTENGMVEIAKLAGTEQRVLNVEGRWADATFNSYGVQDTFAVAVKKNHTQQSQVVEATANHRWILNDGTVKPTSELQPGDRLAFASAPRPDTDNIDYELGVIHGLIYGDGTSTYTQKRLKGYHIRLCGSSRELLPLFVEHGKVCYPASANGDPVVMLYGAFAKTHELKQLPSEDETLEYLLGFIRGWMAADGSVGATGQSTLATTEAGLDWFIQNSARVGILHTGYHEFSDRTNFGDRKKRLFDLRLDRASLVEDDFLISVKRERFKTVADRYYTVTSVEATGEAKEVYCAEVPDTNTFVLDSGLVTGNCSFIVIDSPRAFDEALYILMNGTGLGFSAESKYTNQLPIVNEHFEHTKTIVKVADSKEGWARGLRELIAMLYVGQIPAIDITALRPAGARLKTFGGRSSGPQPLINLFDFVIETFKRAAGRKLTPLECHDIMCKVGEVVVVGGVRRSALISLQDLDDHDMAKAKVGAWWVDNPQRALANNSAAYYQKPSIGEFMEEWLNLYESKSGERGIVNLANMQRAEFAPRRDGSKLMGTNPCLTGDTVIATVDGPRTFAELAEAAEDVQVYAWHPKTKMPVIRWMRRPHKTAENVPVLEIEFDSGLKVKATPNHGFYSFRGKRVEARDLRVGQSVKAWSMSEHRDGHLRVHSWDAKRDKANHQWVHRMMFESEVGQIPEGYVIDHINGNPQDNRIENFQLLTPEEHNSKHYPERFANGFDGTCRNHKVVAIREAGREDVYNGMVEDAHTYVVLDPEPVAGISSGIVSANCGEISLRPYQFCNLTEIIIEESDDLDSLLKKAEIATVLGTIQSSFTNFRYLRKIWRDNCEEERLLGVSLTGQFGNKLMSGREGLEKLDMTLQQMRERTISVNARVADAMGINRSTAITTVKPSGTVSQLTGTSSGMHPWHNDFYIRSVRQDNKDPLTSFMRDAGIPCEADVMKPDDTSVFYFPQKAPAGAVLRKELTAIEHLEFWKVYKTAWTEHNPSITVNVREHEWIEVADWVYKNWDIVGGISFLPYSDHTYQQAPYQDTDESGYRQFQADMPRTIDWSLMTMYEKEDNTSGSQTLSCTSGQCDLVGSAVDDSSPGGQQ